MLVFSQLIGIFVLIGVCAILSVSSTSQSLPLFHFGIISSFQTLFLPSVYGQSDFLTDNMSSALASANITNSSETPAGNSATGNQEQYAAVYNQGVESLTQGKFEEALTAFDKAISINPNKANAYHNRGQALDQLGRYPEALASYEEALSIDPNIALTWNNRGAVLFKLGLNDDALESYDAAISLDPANPDFQKNKQIVIAAMGNTTLVLPPSSQIETNNNNTGGNMLMPSVQPSLKTQNISSILTYTNPENGFQVQYPSDWEFLDNKSKFGRVSGFHGFLDDYIDWSAFAPNASIRYDETMAMDTAYPPYIRIGNCVQGNGKTIDEYLETTTDDYKKNAPKPFELIESKPTTLGGLDAHMLVYTMANEKEMRIFTVEGKQKNCYSITFKSNTSDFEMNLPVVKKIIDSFQLGLFSNNTANEVPIGSLITNTSTTEGSNLITTDNNSRTTRRDALPPLPPL